MAELEWTPLNHAHEFSRSVLAHNVTLLVWLHRHSTTFSVLPPELLHLIIGTNDDPMTE